jgi:putative zinc finger/helix-turn-helix YgiT family protein
MTPYRKSDLPTAPVDLDPCDPRHDDECPVSLAMGVRHEVIPYTAKVKHDGVLRAIAIPALEVPKCHSCGDLIFDEHVDDQINSAFRSHLSILTPARIRAARKSLHLTQLELAEKLGVAEATISPWETGALIQSGAMDNLMRVYFAVPQVRAVLNGKAQDPGLGVEVVESETCNDLQNPSMTTPAG